MKLVALTGLALLTSCTAVGSLKVPAATRVIIAPAVKVDIAAHLQITLDIWGKLSTDTGGIALASSGAKDVPQLITQIFDRGLPPGAPVDVMFAVDTTGSMGDDIDAVKRDMKRILGELNARNPDRRVGVVAYRDKGDDYLTTTVLNLGTSDAEITAAIDSLKVGGGGDWREHVYAGIDTALQQSWRPYASQHIILMGDAPPHEDYKDDPRNYASVIGKATTAPLAVRIHTIGVKCDLICQIAIKAGA